MVLKTGLEDKKKVAIAVVLGVLVLFLVLRMAFQMMGAGSTPPPKQSSTIAQSHPVAPAPQASTSGEHEAVKVSTSQMAKLDPTLHPEWMAAAESLKYTGIGRNIFSMSSAPVRIEKAIGAVRPGAHAAAVAQGPPAPPAIDLKFFGFESRDGSTRKAFLLHGDDVFIASVGDVVDHRYKVVQIAPFSIQIQDIPYNDTQTLPLIQN